MTESVSLMFFRAADAMFVSIVFILCYVILSCAGAGRAPVVLLNDGHTMPTIALGTWLGNSSTGRIVPKGHEVEQAVLWAFEAGYRHVDTAWSYKVEDQVGRAVRTAVEANDELVKATTTPKVCDASCYLNRMQNKIQRTNYAVYAVPREEIFITTKLWNDAHARAAVVPALRASLAQLQMSYVHLYLMHWPLGQFANQTYDNTHYLETWRGMMDAQAQNLTLSIGVSNFNQVMLENIHAHHLTKPAVLQIEWNLNLQQPGLLAYCRKHHIAVMGYTPFGALMKKRGSSPTYIHDPPLKNMAKKYDKTVPQILLRYAIEMGVTPIPKSLTGSRIFENIDIFDFSLDDEDKKILRSFDRGYRSVPQVKWMDHPFYPFEKRPVTTTLSTEATTTEQLHTNESVKMDFKDMTV